jgi:hypothetical protein
MQLISKSQEHTGKQKYVWLHLITLSFQKTFQQMPNMQLPSWNTTLLYKLRVTHFSRNSPPFNEPKVSPLCSYKWEPQHHFLSHINSFHTSMPRFLQFQHNIIYSILCVFLIVPHMLAHSIKPFYLVHMCWDNQ